MVIAAVAGILVGLVSIVPFPLAARKIRTVNPTHSLELLGPFLLTIFASLLILIIGLVVCKLAAPDVVVTYAIAELVAFVVGVIAFGVVLSKRR